MIEGGPSKNYSKTKALMYREPEVWFVLMDKLADMIITYVKAQVEAGVSAIQIFDSWVGSLNAADYQVFRSEERRVGKERRPRRGAVGWHQQTHVDLKVGVRAR